MSRIRGACKKGIWAGLLSLACLSFAFAATERSRRVAVVDGRSGVVRDVQVTVTPVGGQAIRSEAGADGNVFLKGNISGAATVEVTSASHGTSTAKIDFPADAGQALLLHWENAQIRAEFMPAASLPRDSSPMLGQTNLSGSLNRAMRTKTGEASPNQPPPPGLRGAGDECVSATPITCGDSDEVIVASGGFTGNSNGATPGDPVSSCEIAVGGPFAHDASWWYDLVIPADSTVTVSLCSGDVTQDAVISLHNSCGDLTEISCDDDFCDFPNFSAPSLNANVPIFLAAGNYKLVIQAYSGGYDPAIPFITTVGCTPVGPPPYGACCDDLTGVCEDCVQGNCPPPSRFTANTTCADLDPACGEVTGACCDPILGTCADATPAACAGSGGLYAGNFTTCATFVCPCVVNCPPGSIAEGEPDCGPDYVDATNGGCNSPQINPAASSCCFPQAGPGCDDPACQAAVCAQDSFCCAVQWDGLCSGAALTICAPLCDNAQSFPFFGTVACGETICGEGGNYTTIDGDNRDTDWYKIVLTQATQVTWTVEAEFPVLAGIVDTAGVDDCTQVSAFLVSAVGAECEEIVVTECLGAGTWYLFVAPSGFTGAACGSEYTARYDCGTCPSGACCLGSGACVADQTIGQCTGLNGTFQGDGTTCTPNNCPAPQPGDNCTEGIPLTCGGSHSVTVLGSGYTGNSNGASPLDPVTSCEIAVGGPFGHDASWWYDLTIPAESSVVVSMCSTNLAQDAVIGLFDDCGTPVEIACDDDFCDAPNFSPPQMTIPSLAAGNYKINVQAYSGGYDPSVPFNITVTCGAPATGACCLPDGSCAITDGTIGTCNGLGGEWFINQSCPAFAGCPQPILNETCGGATVIPSVPYNIVFDNSEAVASPPPGACNSGSATQTQNDVWFSYTPPSNCGLTFTASMSYDAIVNVWTGPNCNSLTETTFGACENDEPQPISAGFSAIGGTTYYFQVGDWGVSPGGGSTNFTVNCTNATGACCAPAGTCSETTPAACSAPNTFQGLGTNCAPNNCPQPPVNDNCSTPEALPVPGADNASNSLASDDTQSAGTCGTASNLNQAVWYAVTGTGTQITLTTCDTPATGFDTQIQVFCNSCSLPICVTGNDDQTTADPNCSIAAAGPNRKSTVTWCSALGTTYFVAVGGFSTATGTFNLTATSGAACGSPPNCAPAYCTSGPSSTADEDITRVQFNTIDNDTAATPCSTYSNYTAINTTVQQGLSYPLTVTKGDCEGASCFTSRLKVWIDWNQDLDFTDAGEQVVDVSVGTAPCPTLVVPAVNIPIPVTATLGATRMRLVMKEGGTSANTLPCGAYSAGTSWGETEDYTVIIAPPSPPLGGPPFDDDDTDGIPNFCDNCPDIANADQADADNDGVGDPCDACVGFDDNADADGDGVADGCDECPGFNDNVDTDGDGTANGCDGCPNDPAKTSPGACGCGNSDQDSDGDGTADCQDGCPDDPNKVDPGICGCGVADTGDSDGDGVADCVDQCPGVDDSVFAPGCVGAIPTVSHWGLIVLALLLLVLSKVYYGRRPVTA